MGLSLSIVPEHRLNSVLAIDIPPRADGAVARRYMAERFKVQISESYGRDIVRIGQMGEQCRAPNLFRTLHALGVAFSREGAKLDLSRGMAELEAHLIQHAAGVL